MTDERAPTKPTSSSRRSFLKGLGTAAAAGGLISAPGLSVLDAEAHETDTHELASSSLARAPAPQVAADPTDLPPPVDWNAPRTHEVTLAAEEVTAEITFTAPERPGEYTYLCTYPGHWATMEGTLQVEN